jgi:LysM repeat protein
MKRAPVRALAAAALAALAAAAPAAAGIDRAGTTAASFLSVGSGPGVLAMGGAGLSLDGGLAAFDWNPATLARLGGSEAIFNHAALGDQTAQEWGGLGGRLRFGGLTGAITGLFQNEGSFDGRDALGNPTGTFEASSMALGMGVARAVGPFVTAGFGMKYASDNLGGVRGSGVTFDGGLQVRSGGFAFGAAAQNVWGQMKYGSAIYGFPSSYGVGVSYAHAASGLSVALDVNFPAAYYSDIRGGVEWRWNDRFALRTGYRAELGAASGDPLAGPTFGMGAGAHGMWLDYGYLLGGSGAGQHRIGITFHPGSGGEPPEGPDRSRRAFGEKSTEEPPAAAAAKPASSASSSSSTPGLPNSPTAANLPAKPPAPAASTSAQAPTKTASATASGPTAGAAASAGASGPSAKSAAPAGVTVSPAKPGVTVSPAKPGVTASSAKPGAAASPAKPGVASSSAAGATAGAGTSMKPGVTASTGKAAGPVAIAAPPSPPPAYTQRAKSANGASAASAGDRKSAALAPNSDTVPQAPAPVANGHAASPKRDSTSTAKPAPAPVTANPSVAPSKIAPAGTTSGARPDTTARTAPAVASASREPERTGPRPEKVRVKNGQTLADIARIYGTSVPAIMMENNMTRDGVNPGQVIRLPRK